MEPESPYGELTILGPAERRRYIRVRCSCGVEKEVQRTDVLGKKVISCGHIRKERSRAALTTHGLTTGGRKNWHPMYMRWQTMKQRCSNPLVSKYKDYGARGIKVCDRWKKSFTAFLDDVGPPPSPLHTLERKNNDRDYEPENVIWALSGAQSRNRRSNVWLTFEGRTMCAVDWAKDRGYHVSTISYRKRQGWSDEKTLTTPPKFGNR